MGTEIMKGEQRKDCQKSASSLPVVVAHNDSTKFMFFMGLKFFTTYLDKLCFSYPTEDVVVGPVSILLLRNIFNFARSFWISPWSSFPFSLVGHWSCHIILVKRFAGFSIPEFSESLTANFPNTSFSFGWQFHRSA